MTVEPSIDTESGVVTLTVSGRGTYGGIIEALKEKWEDPGYRMRASILWGFRQAEMESISGGDIRNCAGFISQNSDHRGEGCRLALVVAQEVDFGMARMYEGHA